MLTRFPAVKRRIAIHGKTTNFQQTLTLVANSFPKKNTNLLEGFNLNFSNLQNWDSGHFIIK